MKNKNNVGKYIKSGDLEILEKDIKFKDFKKLFKNVNAVISGTAFMNPKINNNQVAQWIASSNRGEVLNSYFGKNTDTGNAKTISICVFENSDNGKFPFIFFSQEEEEWHIENDIEDSGTNDALNDLHATKGGKDFYLVMVFKKNIFTLGNTSTNQKLLK